MDILFYIVTMVGILLNFLTISLMKRIQKRSKDRRQLLGDIVAWEERQEADGGLFYIPKLSYHLDGKDYETVSREGYSRKPTAEKGVMLLVAQDDPEDVRLYHCEKQVRLAFVLGIVGLILTIGGLIFLWVGGK